jgi:phage terminase large subunit-like protein
MVPQTVDVAFQYAKDVAKGKVVASKKVRLACERHQRDLKKAKRKRYPYYFNKDIAQYYIDFFSLLKHSKGEWGGKPVLLEPWQLFIVASLFGWLRKGENTRRFKFAYISTARKNGKSTFLSGIGLELFVADAEPGVEVYTAATKREQAKITHNEAKRMVKKSPELLEYLKIFRDSILFDEIDGIFVPLGADADTMDGLNIHGAIIDELHAHKTRDLWDVLESGTGSRRQPLIVAITTAGFNINGICYELYKDCENILEGIYDNETWFAFIAELDEGDDWTDESVWIKANPNLGVSAKLENIQDACVVAKQRVTKQNNFLCKRMNLWVNQAKRWINLDDWRKNDKDLPDLRGRPCYGGVDLSSTGDLTCVCLEFPLDDGSYAVISHYFIPEDRALDHERTDKVPYKAWAKEGYVTLIPGNVIDYDYVQEWVEEAGEIYEIVEIAFDPYNAMQWNLSMEKQGFTMVMLKQNYSNLSPSLKDMERIIMKHQVVHGNNPVLTFCINNAVTKTGPSGNIMLDKSKATNRIDGAVAFACSHARAIMHEEIYRANVYENRGVRSI